jgi:hypothetical protein
MHCYMSVDTGSTISNAMNFDNRAQNIACVIMLCSWRAISHSRNGGLRKYIFYNSNTTSK